MNVTAILQTALPYSAVNPAIPTLIILGVAVTIVIILVSKPAFLFGRKGARKNKGYQTVDDQYNEAKKEREASIDEILEKIHKKGLHSLNKKEKEILTRHSDKSGR